MEEPASSFFPTHAAPLPSNQVPQGIQPQQVSAARNTLAATSQSNSTPQYIGALNIDGFIPAPPSLHRQNHSALGSSNFPHAYHDWQCSVNGNGNNISNGISNGGGDSHQGEDAAGPSLYHDPMGADLATRHSIPSLQDPSILAPVICNFPPDTAGCGQLPYPHWYETQSIKDDGSYLQTDGYSPHALFTNEPPISPPLSELDTKRRATIDASFLQQPNEVPVYRVTLIESEPTSASSYFPVSPYSHAPQHDSPSNPVHPGQYMFAEQQQAAEEPSAEQKPGTEKLKRKRGRPPTRIDSLESKRTPPNDTSGVSPLSSITFGSIQSEPAPNTGASSSTIGGRPTLQARNRAAANRYRAKTQAAMAQLEAEEREVSIRRQSLLVRAGELRDEVFQLKNEVFKHANCGCPRIEGYLENAAQQAHAKQALFSPPLPGIGGSASSRSSSQS